MFKELIDFVNNKNNVIISVLSAIGTIVLLPVLKNRYERRKKISIESEVIYNIDGRGLIQLGNDSIKQYSNFIYHQLTLKSLNEEVISAIKLTDIKKENNDIADIRYDVGFYDTNQKYLLIAYNNGNIAGDSEESWIDIFAIEEGTFKEIKIDTKEIPGQLIKPGYVKSQFILDIEKKGYIDYFKKNKQFSRLKIKSGLAPDIIISYDRKIDKFVNFPLGFAGPSISDVPFFDLRNSKKEVEVNCSQIISDVKDIAFTIFVDENCILSYKVILKSANYTVKSDILHKVNIRIPVYNQEQTSIFGDFYHLIKDFNPNVTPFSYSVEIIKHLKNDIVYDKFKIAEKFINLK